MSAWLRPACLAFWAFTASITVLSAAHCFTVDLANSVTGATCASLAQAAVANSVPAMPETIPFRRLDEVMSWLQYSSLKRRSILLTPLLVCFCSPDVGRAAGRESVGTYGWIW